MRISDWSSDVCSSDLKSLYAAGLNPATTRYSFRIAERYLTGSTLLELGPAEGVMTELLAGTGKHLTLVEGSGAFCEDLQRRFPQANVVHSLIEEFRPNKAFDNIILDRKSTRLNSSH